MSADTHRAAQLGVQTLDGVGGVDHLSHLGRVSKEGNHMRPMATPHRRDRREPLAPGAVLKFLQRRGGGLGILRSVDGFELLGDRFAVLPGAKIQGIADQMHVMPTSA